MSEGMKKIRSVRKNVLQILTFYPQARNCDKFLIFKIMGRYLLRGTGDVNVINLRLEDLQNLPSFESIIRARAKIQNTDHLCLPTTPEVRRRRKIREEDFRAWAVSE